MPNRGGKKKSRGKNKKHDEERKKDVFLKEEGQEYAKVIKREGGPILSLKLYSGNSVKGTIRGSMRRRCWITAGDIVLVGLRDFQEEKVDVIHKYSDNDARELIEKGQLTNNFVNDLSDVNDLDTLFNDVDTNKLKLERLQKKLDSYSLHPVEYKSKIKRLKEEISELSNIIQKEDSTVISDKVFNNI